MSNDKETARYVVRVTITKDVVVHVPKELASEQNIKDWRRGLWYIDGMNDIAEYAANMAAWNGSGSFDGIGRIGTEIDAKYAQEGRKVDLVYEIQDEDDEVDILEYPTE